MGKESQLASHRHVALQRARITALVVFVLISLAILNPFRLVALDANPLVWAGLGLLALGALGVLSWVVASRWWSTALAALTIAASCIFLLLLCALELFGNFGRPLSEQTLEGSGEGRVVVQTLSTGMGPDSSCVRFDVRDSTGLLARHRYSACSRQEFQVRVTLEDPDRLLVVLDDEIECPFEIDWHEQRLRSLTQQRRCLNFVGS